MNARTFVSNAEGQVQRIEITELELAAGRTVRIMFDDASLDDIRLHLGPEGRVWVHFYKKGGREIIEAVSGASQFPPDEEISNGS